jgi:hypothetical protein
VRARDGKGRARGGGSGRGGALDVGHDY